MRVMRRVIAVRCGAARHGTARHGAVIVVVRRRAVMCRPTIMRRRLHDPFSDRPKRRLPPPLPPLSCADDAIYLRSSPVR